MPYETPSTPKQSIVYSAENTSSQQNFSFWGDPRGMVVYTGRLKKVNNKIGLFVLLTTFINPCQTKKERVIPVPNSVKVYLILPLCG